MVLCRLNKRNLTWSLRVLFVFVLDLGDYSIEILALTSTFRTVLLTCLHIYKPVVPCLWSILHQPKIDMKEWTLALRYD